MLDYSSSNITNQLIGECYQEVYKLYTIPSLIISYVATALIFLIVGLVMGLSEGKKIGRYLILWIFSLILLAIVYLPLILIPDIMLKVYNFFS